MDIQRKRKVDSPFTVPCTQEEHVMPNKQQKIEPTRRLSTNQKRALRRQRIRERTQACRAKMTEMQKSIARDKNRQRMRNYRAQTTSPKSSKTHTNQKRALRRQKIRERTQACRAKMTEMQKSIARDKNRQRMRIYRAQTTSPKSSKTHTSCIKTLKPMSAYFDEGTVSLCNIGCNSYVMHKCLTLNYITKQINCSYGKVKIPDIKPPPEELQYFFTDQDAVYKEFRKNIRQCNSSLALASVSIDLGNTFKFDDKGPWAYKAYKICGQ